MYRRLHLRKVEANGLRRSCTRRPTKRGDGGVALLLVAFFHFWLLVFVLWWVVPFCLLPALGFFIRGIASRMGGKPSQHPNMPEDRKEKELLEALERYGEITPARVALETSLSVSEADRMLTELAKNGHIEVRAREGRLGYALWDRDGRELTDWPRR